MNSAGSDAILLLSSIQSPRSINRQRSLQKGRQGLSVDKLEFLLQLGQEYFFITEYSSGTQTRLYFLFEQVFHQYMFVEEIAP